MGFPPGKARRHGTAYTNARSVRVFERSLQRPQEIAFYQPPSNATSQTELLWFARRCPPRQNRPSMSGRPSPSPRDHR